MYDHIEALKSYLNSNDAKRAVEELKLLYHDGKILTNTIITTGILPAGIQDFGTLTTVVVNLNKVFTAVAEHHQSNNKLHRVLSKVYRIFVELMWFQCQINDNSPILPDTKQEITVLLQKMADGLGKNEIQAKFNYRCALEAAKHLNPPSQVFIQKYTGDIFAIAGAIAEKSVSNFAKAFLQLAIDIDQDWVRDWYKDVHCINWIIVPLKTIPSVELDIITSIEGFNLERHKLRTKDSQYTIGLAIISKKFIQHPKADPDLKKKSLELLAILFRLKEKGLKTKVLASIHQKNYTPELISTIAESQDKFFKTRRFTEQCFNKILDNPLCAEQREQIDLIKKNPPLKETIKADKTSLKTRKAEIKNQKNHITLQISKEKEKNKVRGGEMIDPIETIKQLNEQFDTKTVQEQQIYDKYQQLSHLEKWIPNIDTEETQYLQEIFGSYKPKDIIQ